MSAYKCSTYNVVFESCLTIFDLHLGCTSSLRRPSTAASNTRGRSGGQHGPPSCWRKYFCGRATGPWQFAISGEWRSACVRFSTLLRCRPGDRPSLHYGCQMQLERWASCGWRLWADRHCLIWISVGMKTVSSTFYLAVLGRLRFCDLIWPSLRYS